eukprot:EG_transcript_10752
MLPKLLLYSVLPLSVGSFVLATHTSHIDKYAEDFTSVVLAFQKLQSSPTFRPDAAGLHSRTTSAELLLRHARRLQEKVGYHARLCSFLNHTYEDDTLYRLEWMRVQLQAICTMLQPTAMGNQENPSFDEQSWNLQNTRVPPSFLTDARTKDLHARLDPFLPPGSTLLARLRAFREPWFIPKAQYEPQFRRLVEDVLQRMGGVVPELRDTVVQQKYFDDIAVSYEAACEPNAPGSSTMVVNVARPVTWDKAQQLAVHELTHHLQFTLMQRHLYPRCPELSLALDEGPMGMILEGGAELAVDLFLPPAQREADLAARVPPALRPRVARALAVERITWAGLFPCVVRIARDMVDGRITKEEATGQMEREALKERDSWPNVEFIQETGAYVQGYSWGKQLIHDYLQAQRPASLLDAYVAFMKRPLTPGMMEHALRRRATPAA